MSPEDPVVICGAGAAGIAAALAVGQSGSQAILVEKSARIGGTVVKALIHTIGGLYDSEGAYLNLGLPKELAERLLKESPLTHKRKMGRVWTLSVDPQIYAHVVESWLTEFQNIAIKLQTRAKTLKVQDGTIQSVTLSSHGRTRVVKPKALIDTTGSAELVRLADPERVLESEQQAAAGLIFSMNGVEPGALKFPNSIELVRNLRRAAENGELPPDCAMAWVDIGTKEGESYIKLFVPLSSDSRNPPKLASVTRKAHATRDRVVQFLQKQPAFSQAQLIQTGSIGIRDAGRVVGEYTLSGADVIAGQKFNDTAGKCCWPIEYWHPTTGVSLQYLPPGQFYEIPLRALKVKGYANLWAAGKCLSADHVARASARVAGCCWAMGEAAGNIAAQQ